MTFSAHTLNAIMATGLEAWYHLVHEQWLHRQATHVGIQLNHDVWRYDLPTVDHALGQLRQRAHMIRLAHVMVTRVVQEQDSTAHVRFDGMKPIATQWGDTMRWTVRHANGQFSLVTLELQIATREGRGAKRTMLSINWKDERGDDVIPATEVLGFFWGEFTPTVCEHLRTFVAEARALDRVDEGSTSLTRSVVLCRLADRLERVACYQTAAFCRQLAEDKDALSGDDVDVVDMFIHRGVLEALREETNDDGTKYTANWFLTNAGYR